MSGIYVTFLGEFKIFKEEEMVVAIKSSKNRVKKLIGLLLIEGKSELTDRELLARIWQTDYFPSQDSALTNLVYLARKTLRKVDEEKEFIVRKDGRYIWNPQIPVATDINELENIGKKLEEEEYSDLEKLELGRRAMSLYEGELAENFEYSSWCVNLNEYYNNLYFKITEQVCRLLEKVGDEESWQEVIDVSTKAVKFDLADDRFYINIFRALKCLGKRSTIVSYYENIKKLYYEKNSEPIADEIKKIYAWAIRGEEVTFEDIDTLTESLRERSKETIIKGAYYCEKEMFKNLMHFILRNSMRNRRDVVVMLVSIFDEEDTMSVDERELEMDKLEDVIRKSLRKDDVFSRYSVNKFLIMPFDCKREKIRTIDERIYNRFEKTNKNTNLSIDIVNFAMEEKGYQMLF